jgi:NitT/TauT family transport system ATP-binding protein
MADPPIAVVEACGITKTYGHGRTATSVLRDISFRIDEGQFISLVGPSGCGKSTLLQILGGLLSSTTGDVLIDGARLTSPLPGKIAIVFQDPTLLPWKTALENVLFPLEAQRVDPAERRQRAEEMLELVGLADFRNRFPHQLSGGMKQRVSIARGLAQNPRIILMDEPFGALDEQTRMKMGHELLRIWDRTRKTILFITHSLIEALYLSDVVLVMGRHPRGIVDRLTVDFARPRTYDMIGSPEFGAARNRIWHSIAEEDEGNDEKVSEP